MNEPNSPENPETFADAIAKLRTFGAWQDQARIDAVVAAHEREVKGLHALWDATCDNLHAANATIAELKEALRWMGNQIPPRNLHPSNQRV